MKSSLRFKILGSFALIVLLALGAAVGTGAKLTRSRYDRFALQRDVDKAESLSTALGEWTAEAGSSETPPPLPPSVALFFLPFQDSQMKMPQTGMMMGRRMPMEHMQPDRMVVTDLTGKVLLDTSGYGLNRMDGNNPERTSIRDGNDVVGYLYIGRMIPDPHRPPDVSFLQAASLITWLVTGIIFIFAMLLGLILTRHILGPIKTLNAATRKVESGDLKVRVPDSRSDELGDLSRGFNSMTEFLESADIQRRRLIADSAHELRTPVSLIRTRIEMMEEGIYPMDGEGLTALAAESDRLIHLVDELKMLANLESSEMGLSREDLNLNDLIREVIEASGPAIRRGKIDVEIAEIESLSLSQSELHPVVSGDRGKLQRLLNNLLSNALRYAQSRIIISIRPEAGQADRVELNVEDDGPGIPEEDRLKVFERYYRVDASRNRSSGGSGLGLAICSEIAKAHGGRIEVGVSRVLGGAELKVSLPFKTAKSLK